MLDRAILRPGRFDRLIEVPLPDEEGRQKIFEIHTRDMAVAEGIDFEALAADSEGMSGADIRAVCTEAGMFAIRDDREEITETDFREAKQKLEAEADDEDVSKTFA
jgi:proteasome regulatory subunit